MDLCKVFEDTRNKSNNDLKADTDKLISDTIVYSDKDYDEYSIKLKKNKNRVLDIEFNTNDTVTEICKDRNIHIAALNFADAATPGGSVLYGAKTQEECLCRCSNLYESIISDKCDKEFYSKNLSNYHNTRKIIYSPNCIFFLDKDYVPLEDYIKCDIITSPAPFEGCADNEYIYTKMKDILIVANLNKVDKLILGMWGCGAFNNDLDTFASFWAKAILEVKPTMKIVFANYSRAEDRPIEFYNAFMKEINRINNIFLHKNITASF